MPFNDENQNEKDVVTLKEVSEENIARSFQRSIDKEVEDFDADAMQNVESEHNQKNTYAENRTIIEARSKQTLIGKKAIPLTEELEDASTPLRAKPQQPQLQKKQVADAHEKIAATPPSKTLKPVDKISAYAAEHRTEVKYDPKQHVLSDSSGIICQVPIASKPFNVKANPPKLANEFVFPNKELSPTGANFVENLLAEGPYELTCNKLETALNFMKSASKSKDFVKYIDNLTFPTKAPFNTPEALAAITEVKKQIVEKSGKIELKSATPKLKS